MTLPDLTFENARVLTPEGLVDMPLSLSEGRIAGSPSGARVDLSGHLVLPGIVDIHGDGFERHLAPRRGALESLRAGLLGLDAELAANGITTAVVAQFWSWEGGMRGPDFAEDLADALAVARTAGALRADLLLQLRFEIGMIDDVDRVLAFARRVALPYLVMNDHLSHNDLAAGKNPPRITSQALKARRSPEEHRALMQAMHDRWEEVPGALARLCTGLGDLGVLMGSHDDHDPEARARGYRRPDRQRAGSDRPQSHRLVSGSARADEERHCREADDDQRGTHIDRHRVDIVRQRQPELRDRERRKSNQQTGPQEGRACGNAVTRGEGDGHEWKGDQPEPDEGS